jgi:hypothetical protein
MRTTQAQFAHRGAVHSDAIAQFRARASQHLVSIMPRDKIDLRDIPQPEVRELPFAEGWLAYDLAQAVMDGRLIERSQWGELA